MSSLCWDFFRFSLFLAIQSGVEFFCLLGFQNFFKIFLVVVLILLALQLHTEHRARERRNNFECVHRTYHSFTIFNVTYKTTEIRILSHVARHM